jgi:hypothetical protein
MSDTPETDFVRKSNDCDAAGFCNMMSHARRLERERDEARQKLNCPRCEAGDDNFARLLRTRDTLLAENRDLQKQLAAVNDQLLEAQAVIRSLRKTLRET